MTSYDRIYVGGEWVSPRTTDTVEVVNPTTEETVGRVPRAGTDDVSAAAAAARGAQRGWRETLPTDRAACLARVHDGLVARRDELARTIASEVGMPLSQAEAIQVESPIRCFELAADLAETYRFRTVEEHAVVDRVPLGVVAAITPWNYPLHQIAAKVAFALAAGCTVLLKPSEVAPLNAFILAEVIDRAGLPAGVFNLVSGRGRSVGEAMCTAGEIDMVSFTGSTMAGRRIAELAAHSVKKVALELGGKSPNVLLDDADFEHAVASGVQRAFRNAGQTCTALTRMLVPRSRLADVEAIASAAAGAVEVGDPFDPATTMGPLVSASQRESVLAYVRRGLDEGARLVAGGLEPPAHLQRGFFVQPTIFSEVDPAMTIAQEEIFGPVLAIIPYDSDEKATEIANGTPYGLAAGVWSSSLERALAFADTLDAGRVEINGMVPELGAPFGGCKQSGYGREVGRHGLEEFLYAKAFPCGPFASV